LAAQNNLKEEGDMQNIKTVELARLFLNELRLQIFATFFVWYWNIAND
tara:strand:+ start:2335 stop:2478 length:144 start_codon:yes stop_codon:yes gene_type:complete